MHTVYMIKRSRIYNIYLNCRMLFQIIHTYSVFFFMVLKVFVNLTYLYLSEINKQGLIFSVGSGHLIIKSSAIFKKYNHIFLVQILLELSAFEMSKSYGENETLFIDF